MTQISIICVAYVAISLYSILEECCKNETYHINAPDWLSSLGF